MKAFEWANAASVDEAVKLLKPVDATADPDESRAPMGGGQDLLTTMKAYIVRPPRVVNLKTIWGVGSDQMDKKGNVRIGATATMTALEENPGAEGNVYRAWRGGGFDCDAADSESGDGGRESLSAAAVLVFPAGECEVPEEGRDGMLRRERARTSTTRFSAAGHRTSCIRRIWRRCWWRWGRR